MSEHITHTPSTKRLERSSDRMLAGVSGGLGRYFDLSPAFFRLGFVVLTLLGGAGILVYLAAVLVIPDEGKERSIAEAALAERRDRPWALVGLGLVGVALAVLVARATLWHFAGLAWVIVLLAGLAILWSHDSRRGERRSRTFLRSTMTVIVALLVTLVVAAVAAVSVAFAWFDVSLDDGVGDRREAPASLAELRPTYELGVGDLRLDLSRLGPITQPTRVEAKVGVGDLRIVVPRDVAVAVDARAKVGDVHVLGRQEDGRNTEIHVGSGPLVVDARIGAGRVEVTRAVR